MPSRGLSLAIIFFWLGTTGWLYWHDLRPAWRTGEPPPFHIDPVDEVQRGGMRIFWTVERDRGDGRGAQKVFEVQTWAEYHQEDDTFTLHAQLKSKPVDPTQSFTVGGFFKVASMTSEYRINRLGQMQSLRAEVNGSPQQGSLANLPLFGSLIKKRLRQGDAGALPPTELQVLLWGEVRGGQFFAHCRGSAALTDQRIQMDLPPTEVAHSGSLLMPLHPVNRIHGLRPGQRWRQPLVDPFRDAFAALPGFSGGARSVNAHVLPQAQALPLGDGTETTCLVIEYEDEGNNVGRTWVEQDSERVQRQEAALEGKDRWIMTRDLAHKSGISPLRQPNPTPPARPPAAE